MYYDYSKILSYKAVFNFIIGARGCGKSYGAKKMLIKKFIKTGQQFIYLRRFKTELQKVNTWFDDIASEFPDHEFKVKGKTFYIDGQLAGWAIALSTSQIEKSNSYKGVKYIMFDEFLIDTTGSYHYLRDEYNVLCQFYSTVDRDRDEVQVLLLGNALSINNPYFNALNIQPNLTNIIVGTSTNQLGHRVNLYTVEVYSDPVQTSIQRQTRFGQLVTQTPDIADFMFDNKFMLDDVTDIVKLQTNPRHYKHVVSIIYNSQVYSVDMYKSTNVLFINSYNMFDDVIYSLDTQTSSSDHPLLHSSYKSQLFKLVHRYLGLGLVRYSDVLCKSVWTSVIL